MKVSALLIISVVVVTENARAQTPRTTPSMMLESLLSRGYDWRDRSRRHGFNDPPTNVSVNIYIRRLKITGQELEAEITFRQNWNDHRLAYTREFSDAPPPGYLSPNPMDKSRVIWQPDTFFQNAYDLKVENVPSTNEMIRIYPNGDVLSSQKIYLKTTCPMEFERFPNDVLKCSLEFASYAHTTQDIIYEWKKDTPVQQKVGLARSLPDFTLDSVTTENCSSKTNTGEYSCLRMIMNFQRKQAAVSSKLYLIPLLLALLSLLPMIINAQSILLRVLIGFFCLSTLILHWSIIGEELPKVGYSTGAEFWLTRCLAFIAATFVQLIVFYWIGRVVDARKERRSIKERVAKEKLVLTKKDGTEEDVVLIHTEPIVPERKISISLLIDLISLAIFILAFLVFLLHYFTKY
jgi:hypothetical protein